jgi:bifunctional non-homologous end joining protein LigD
VGTGFSDRVGREFVARLKKIERRDMPFVDVPRADRIDTHWVDPKMVAEVTFTAWTRDGRIRHPSFKGMHEDKDQREITIERPADD